MGRRGNLSRSSRHCVPQDDGGFLLTMTADFSPLYESPLDLFLDKKYSCLMEKHHIGIVGHGAWGSALAKCAYEAGHLVTAWSRQHTTAASGYQLTQSLTDLAPCDILIVAIPSAALKDVLSDMQAAALAPPLLINATKGLEQSTGHLLSTLYQEAFPEAARGVLSGPNLAHEISAGLSAASSLYCPAAFWPKLKTLFNPHSLRLYHCTDEIGIQIGGALKNIIAIATGYCHGAKLGKNMEALVMTRGLHEMVRLGVRLGAQVSTFSGLSGMGDTILTCSSLQSRNFRFGMMLSEGSTVSEALQQIGTVEGVSTASSLTKLLNQHPVDLPICQAVIQLIQNEKKPADLIQMLLARPLKKETDHDTLPL